MQCFNANVLTFSKEDRKEYLPTEFKDSCFSISPTFLSHITARTKC